MKLLKCAKRCTAVSLLIYSTVLLIANVILKGQKVNSVKNLVGSVLANRTWLEEDAIDVPLELMVLVLMDVKPVIVTVPVL